jgi:DNA-binding SARP family transcriptional activator
MARLSIYLLGPFHVLRDGSSVTGFESDKARALLAYLALEADRPQPRTYLAGLLWPDYPEQDARHNLRQALSNLRHAIADASAATPCLQVTHETIQHDRQSDCWLDVHAFDALLVACRQHAHRRLDLCLPCIERLQQAAELYRGSFLQGFAPGAGLAFQEWMLSQEERYHRRVADVLCQLARCHAWCGEHELALRYARRHVALEPWREEAHRHIMRALALSGQRNAALLQYQRCRRILADELGVEPEEETVALYHQVRDGADLAPRATRGTPTP